jgi:hypothetical protein
LALKLDISNLKIIWNLGYALDSRTYNI